ncbi:MAG: DUF4157 domain-containing protein [Cyanobacteria bacterium P01_H01_bin.21]
MEQSTARPWGTLTGNVMRSPVDQKTVKNLRQSAQPVAQYMVQAKLMVGPVGDKYEQEADRVAAHVVQTLNSATVSPSVNSPLQRTVQDTETDRVQMKFVAPPLSRISSTISKATTNMSRKSARPRQEHAGGDVISSIESKIQNMRGGGQTLEPTVQRSMEQAFGADFSGVRVHGDTEPAANQLNQALGARAFTTGQDIFFRRGAYEPRSREGQTLLAHELTHVVQQNSEVVRKSPAYDLTPMQQHGDTIQRLSITNEQSSKGDCGAYQVRWTFSLDNPAPEDGYIVQQIDYYEDTATCNQPTVTQQADNPVLTFWEAWFVPQGMKVDQTTVDDKWTDQSSAGEHKNSSGDILALGTVKFFSKTTTGDLGDFGKAPQVGGSGWAPGKEPQSGALPSTHTKPGWWYNEIEGPTFRYAGSRWNCCGDEEAHTSVAVWNP